MEKITFAKKIVLKRIKEKMGIDDGFQDYFDHCDYSEYGDYGDSNCDWT